VSQLQREALIRSCKWWLVFNKTFFSVIILLVITTSNVNAVVNAEKSRVVFNNGSDVESLSLVNSDKGPVLVQVWTDAGDVTISPDQIHTPIVVSPPIFKIKPGQVINLRLKLATTKDLPKDRESLYWLNIYQIPPNTDMTARDKRKIVLPLKIRLKIFVRPKNIDSLTEVEVKKIKFSIKKDSDDQKLLIHNPTPWHMSIPYLRVGDFEYEKLMLLPFSSESISIPITKKITNNLYYELINDYGVRWRNTIKIE